MVETSSKKIVSQDRLVKIVQNLKQHGSIIVTTNGSFDLLHIGHVTMLQEAKSLGDVLIVGMNSDVSVKRYKGKSRPICPQEHRAKMLAALECTDYITIFDEGTPINLLNLVQPDIHVNSPEHGYDCIEREVVEQHGGRIYLARLVEGMSTSQLIQRILEVSSHEPGQAIFVNPSDLVRENQEETFNILRQFQTLGFRLFVLAQSDEIIMRQVQKLFQQQGVEFGNAPRTFERADHIEKIAEDYDISLAKSFIISSAMQDIQMGREVNCKTILLKKRVDAEEGNSNSYIGPNYTAEDFQKAANLILRFRQK
jgi:rfaE bifunctional protein nucleotidyltransferase chain/domain